MSISKWLDGWIDEFFSSVCFGFLSPPCEGLWYGVVFDGEGGGEASPCLPTVLQWGSLGDMIWNNDNIVVCQGYCSNVPQTGGLNNRKLLSHGQEAQSPRSRCQQGCFLLEAVRICCSCVFPSRAETFWHSLAGRCVTLISAFVFTWRSPVFMSVSRFPFCKETGHIGLGAYLSII